MMTSHRTTASALPACLLATLLCSSPVLAQSSSDGWPGMEDVADVPPKPAPIPVTRESLLATVTVSEDGRINLPPGSKDSAWLDFYTGTRVAPKTSAGLRSALEQMGWRFADGAEGAKAGISVSGYFRMWAADAGKYGYNTGKVFLGELLEPEVALAAEEHTQSADNPRSGKFLNFDIGAAQQASRATGGALSGAGVAMGLDWVADVTGLRSAINRGFINLFGIEKSKPGKTSLKRNALFCTGNCARTTHEVTLLVSFWEGKTLKPGNYTLTLRLVEDDINQDALAPMVEIALSRLIENLDKALRPS